MSWENYLALSLSRNLEVLYIFLITLADPAVFLDILTTVCFTISDKSRESYY